ncbi:hypothetical protein F7725_019623 [Dissostichus mawsoni]|uniref:Uncharacterized protein n=1 Tax=Dissostichus mawsoni TaxID=36200 RepID=A0A7J5YK91_DISMA|nr:hypothetical protein F7725_019623 [Dissostichus mawsoni]
MKCCDHAAVTHQALSSPRCIPLQPFLRCKAADCLIKIRVKDARSVSPAHDAAVSSVDTGSISFTASSITSITCAITSAHFPDGAPGVSASVSWLGVETSAAAGTWGSSDSVESWFSFAAFFGFTLVSSATGPLLSNSTAASSSTDGSSNTCAVCRTTWTGIGLKAPCNFYDGCVNDLHGNMKQLG